MSCDLTTIDCFGREVVLDHSNWVKHVDAQQHLEVIPYREHFAAVLREPDIVVEVALDRDLHFYKKGIGEGKYTDKYLHLVVKRLEQPPDKVATWWFSPYVVKGTIVWPR
jgi:hypothetical protein